MNRVSFAAMFVRIGAYVQKSSSVFAWLRDLLAGPKTYHPSAHYMRGPGPKWREKHPAE